MSNTEFKKNSALDIYRKVISDPLFNGAIDRDLRKIETLANIAPEGKELYIKRVIFKMKEDIEDDIIGSVWVRMKYKYELISVGTKLFNYLDECYLDLEDEDEKEGLGDEFVVKMRKKRESRLENLYWSVLMPYLKCMLLETKSKDHLQLDRLPRIGNECEILRIKRFLLENDFIADISDRDFLYWFGIGEKQKGMKKITWTANKQLAREFLVGVFKGVMIWGQRIITADIERLAPKCFLYKPRGNNGVVDLELTSNKRVSSIDRDKIEKFLATIPVSYK